MDFFNGGLTTRLSETNYEVWKSEMEQFFMKEELWNIVISEKPENELDNQEWKGKNMAACVFITESIEMSHYDIIENCECASEMWKKIEDNFKRRSSCEQYIQEICDLVCEKSQDVEKNVDSVLGILNKLLIAVKCQDEKVDLEALRPNLIEKCTMSKEAAIQMKEENVVLVEKDKVQKLLCWFCRKEGHFKRNCSKYKSWKARKQERSCHTESPEEQKDWSCYFCKELGHFKRDCEKYKMWKIRREKFESFKKQKQELNVSPKEILEVKSNCLKSSDIQMGDTSSHSKTLEVKEEKSFNFYEHLRRNDKFFGTFSKGAKLNESKETKKFDEVSIEDSCKDSVETASFDEECIYANEL